MNPNQPMTAPPPTSAGDYNGGSKQLRAHPQEVASHGHNLMSQAEAEKAMLREEIKQRDLIIEELVIRISNFVNS
jgi:hypothetical protein